MILSKIGLVTRMANPLVWRTLRLERTPVAHTLWNVRTPYPTAILCSCSQVLYRFGTDLRHRDGTRCGQTDPEPCQHTDANDAGVCPCGVTVTQYIYPDGRTGCSWPDDCPTVDACARGCVVPARNRAVA